MCVYFMNRIIYFNAEVIQTTGNNSACRLATLVLLDIWDIYHVA